MDRSTLYFHHGMKTAERNNGYWFRVRPTDIRSEPSQYSEGITDHIHFLHSSLVKMTAHTASSPIFTVPSLIGPDVALSFPLSPCTSPSIPRSTMLKSIACTARLSLWFFDRILALRMSDKIVLRIKARRMDEVVRGSRGKSDLRRSIDVITFLFRSITRFWTSVLRVSGVNVP